MPPPPLPAWNLPAQVGKYTLLRRMAVGGMAELYLALMRGMAAFEKVVVIKRILPQLTQDAEFVEMLLAEARIAATLSHPSIAQTFDVGQHDGTYFIAMEYVHGDDIRGLVRQMRKRNLSEFPLEHAIEILIGVCKGLSYAHEKRDLDGTPLEIVHRDISPQNVVVAFSGEAKIVDFGIAKSRSKVQTTQTEETESGKIKGKIAYMSPEQALGQEVDTRSDLFAVGVLLFELTTGRRLFRAPSDFETLKLICEQRLPRPSEVREGYSPELERIVMRALERKKEQRYQTARELQADLEGFARRHQLEASSGSLSKFMRELYAGEPLLEHDVGLAPREVEQVLETRSVPIVPFELDAPSSDFSGRTPSTPAASHTLKDAQSLPARRSSQRWWAAAAVAAVGLTALVLAVRPDDEAEAEELPVARASLSLTSEPAGGAIWIDGDLRAERTPAVLEGLPIGRELSIKITHEGFESFHERRTLSAEPTQVQATLVRGSLSARVSVRPVEAILSLDGQRIERSASVNGGRAELVLEGLSAEPHELLVQAPGFADKRVSFSGAAFENKALSVDLDPVAPAAPSAVVASVKHGGGRASEAPKPHEPSAPEPKPNPAAAKGTGKLNVGASGGWCNVSINGQARGATPLAGLELGAGSHKIVCTTPDGATHSSSVTIVADNVARVKFTL